ncbi:MAG TPA: hypothetical protein PLM58_02440 [Novosphingobium sp.]|nr:hypothetical protein [Novosphingobium sp. 28-62-57]HQS68458.1 hypothetical protein [Novosphingobium sp.]
MVQLDRNLDNIACCNVHRRVEAEEYLMPAYRMAGQGRIGHPHAAAQFTFEPSANAIERAVLVDGQRRLETKGFGHILAKRERANLNRRSGDIGGHEIDDVFGVDRIRPEPSVERGHSVGIPTIQQFAAFVRPNSGEEKVNAFRDHPAAGLQEPAASIGHKAHDAVIYAEITDVIANKQIDPFGQFRAIRRRRNAMIVVCKTSLYGSFAGNIDGVSCIYAPNA